MFITVNLHIKLMIKPTEKLKKRINKTMSETHCTTLLL